MSSSHPVKSVVLWHLSGCIATFYEHKDSNDNKKRVPLDTVCFTNKAYLAFRQVDILKVASPAVPYLSCLTSLLLQNNNLKTLPLEIWRLTNLQELNVACNQLTTLPIEIGLLVNLKELFVHNNQLTEIPCQLGNLIHLTTLDLTANQLIELPAEILKLGLNNLWIDYNCFKLVDRGSRFISLKSICIQTIGLTCLEDEESKRVVQDVPVIQQEDLLQIQNTDLLPTCNHCQSALFHSTLQWIKLHDSIPYLYKACSQNCFKQIKLNWD